MILSLLNYLISNINISKLLVNYDSLITKLLYGIKFKVSYSLLILTRWSDYSALTWSLISVVEIRIRNWLPFFKIGAFCRLLIAIPLKMYSKIGQPRWILVCQMLKLVGKWPTVISSTVARHMIYCEYNNWSH